ncbi:pentapeptide repeat-containing protein [Sphingorhabdus sp. YGSMI21]|uniref:pentapeptide repeat-containing protein n=1 Tax=Sphingorhabdus sp. YGSMI21 TaxID=2077182 RepID=UPI0013DAAFA2|nr:pentapeptide repeat-containing protein [Sphingorhabdus sp. YGSMI21]
MPKPWLPKLVLVMATLAGTTASQAESAAAGTSCASASGDIWGDGQPDIAREEVDGERIESLADFSYMTERRIADVTFIRGGRFSGWDFSGMSLPGICFEESDLSGANFAGALAPGAGFIKADLSGANMNGVHMSGVLFRNAGLKNVTAKGADFSDGHFDGGWFEGSVEGWDLDGADMSGFTFACGITVPDGCPVYQGGAKMTARGADFTDATLHSFGLHAVDLAGARIDGTIIGPRQLPYLAKSDFDGAVILRGGEYDASLTSEEAKQLLAGNVAEETAQTHPSFDCGKAASKVEREICGEYADDLRAADRAIADLYKRAKAKDAGVQNSQRAWLKQRNLCDAAEYPGDCIRESYSTRKGQLLGLLGEQDWLDRGEAALFVDDLLPLPAAMAGSDLFGKIAPVLIGASMTEILIERGDDGLYAIKGNAVGANAHLCSIYASHLYLDNSSGWYIPVSEGAANPVFRIFGNRLEIFAGGHPDYEKHPEAADIMSCGMRAGFGETIRANVSDALIERYRKSLNEDM